MGPRARARGIVSRMPDGRVVIRASMGPRARARGIKMARSRIEWIKRLQWGRERALAELRELFQMLTWPVAASMGPRARARGIGIWEAIVNSINRASMGPRARARGIKRWKPG